MHAEVERRSIPSRRGDCDETLTFKSGNHLVEGVALRDANNFVYAALFNEFLKAVNMHGLFVQKRENG